MSKSIKPRRHCAIYTRKSSEEGLEQEFNSLHAQREACEAYIKSQCHEGWQAIPTRYDDGGFSGGTLERPGLRQLIQDIQAQQVDVIVVYKVDRLTRALSDFAKLVEIFDQQNVSFVSVTQQFNTTSSMGRLTLNVLLSFAQFEREVTGERIRDKIAASKKKGIWMGGYVPLGYDVQDRQLIVNKQEAAVVQYIFQTYLRLGVVSRLKEHLDAKCIVSKVRYNTTPHQRGGRPMSRGLLYRLLQNRLYLGEIVHKNKSYPGQHESIIDRTLWDQVQATLDAQHLSEKRRRRIKNPSLLAGLLYDDQGERMSPTHTVKQGKRYRYYVSQSLIKNTKQYAHKGRRIPAADIEQLVIDQFLVLLADQGQLLNIIKKMIPDAPSQQGALNKAEQLVETWSHRVLSEQRSILIHVVKQIKIHPKQVEIRLLSKPLINLLGEIDNHVDRQNSQEKFIILSVTASMKRAGMEMKLIVDVPNGHHHQSGPNTSLIKLIVKAYLLKKMFIHNKGQTLKALSRQHKINPSYFTRLVRLTFLAPDITKAILEGRQPPELTATRLMRNTRFPLNWQDQRKKLGFKI
ncbi:MAG: recombinase family protein [Candidatus Thiodiazotropha taylori]|nr:recombinase family protein [Candidatus Thiodiazotropha taylori]